MRSPRPTTEAEKAEEMIESPVGNPSAGGDAASPDHGPESAQLAHRPPRETRRVARFLEALSETANVSDASRISGLPRRTAYDLRSRDAEFEERWEDALEEGTDALEREARRRALDGIEEPVFYQGEQVGTVRKYADSMLMFLLRGRRPEVFAPNKVDVDAIREQAQRDLVMRAADFLEELADRRGMSRVEVLKGFQRALEAGDTG